jgi:hypothetical protein
MDRNVNNRSGNARGNADDIRPDLGVPCPGVFDISMVNRETSPAGQANQDQSNKEIEQPCFHGNHSIPMAPMQGNKGPPRLQWRPSRRLCPDLQLSKEEASTDDKAWTDVPIAIKIVR